MTSPRMRCRQPGCEFTTETLPEMRAHYLAEHPDAKGQSESAKRQREERAAARGAPAAVKPDTSPPASTPRAGTLERRLLEFFGLIALLPSMLGDQFCSAHLIANAPTLAQVWARAADEHKWLKDALEKMLGASTLTAAVGTTVMTAYPILVHHGMAPKMKLPFMGDGDGGAAGASVPKVPTPTAPQEGARAVGLVG